MGLRYSEQGVLCGHKTPCSESINNACLRQTHNALFYKSESKVNSIKKIREGKKGIAH